MCKCFLDFLLFRENSLVQSVAINGEWFLLLLFANLDSPVAIRVTHAK